MDISTELKEKLNRKMGRNEPCICGSKKKFKKCCEGQKAQVRLARLLPVCSKDQDKAWIQSRIEELDEKAREAAQPLSGESIRMFQALTLPVVMDIATRNPQ